MPARFDSDTLPRMQRVPRALLEAGWPRALDTPADMEAKIQRTLEFIMARLGTRPEPG